MIKDIRNCQNKSAPSGEVVGSTPTAPTMGGNLRLNDARTWSIKSCKIRAVCSRTVLWQARPSADRRHKRSFAPPSNAARNRKATRFAPSSPMAVVAFPTSKKDPDMRILARPRMSAFEGGPENFCSLRGLPLLCRVSDAGQREPCDIHRRPASESRQGTNPRR
jgi:hypothetical protein